MIDVEVWICGQMVRLDGAECWLCPFTTRPELDFRTQCRIEW